MNRFLPLCLLLAPVVLLALSSCDRPSPSSDGKPVVFVPVAPYAGLLDEIAGDLVQVEVIVDEKSDPHTYTPTPREITRLSNAAIYFTVELPFEMNLVKKLESGNPSVKIVNLVENLNRRTFAPGEHDHADHDHDDHDHDHDDHDHEHGDHAELDPHVWLAPGLLVKQVETMTASLSELLDDEASRTQLEERSRALVKRIQELDKELAAALSPLRGKSFYVFHGAFGYFAEAYGLKQKPVQINGRTPEPKQLVALVEQAQADGVTVIFVQPQFDQSSAKSLADSIGGTVVSIDPLARDTLANLRDIAAKIGSN